ncbi:single-stranded DNA-binding protein [Myceligenerans xiligouense]|uniref:Single-stranded DNA-binding protein n=1 Tax=Myceligenerans xiligouense TaxID=253184 RepID=A0A3N4YNY9_9MICO|nr:single-stranded DNA-binding protein [Myceligenerans xiligouense]RPF22343.1 single-strand DNA-binding protein [Myceligenerans xiligouense]
MSNDVRVTVTGNAGSDPVIRRSSRGTEWTRFSVASTRRIRATDGEFYDGPTIWFQVKAWGHAAVNISESVTKGQPVVVAGRLEVEEWGDDARRRTTLVINADSVGPNLMRGRAKFQRVIPADEPGQQERPSAGARQDGPGRGVPDVDADAWATAGPDAPAGPDEFGEVPDGAAEAADGSWGAPVADAGYDGAAGAGHQDGPTA